MRFASFVLLSVFLASAVAAPVSTESGEYTPYHALGTSVQSLTFDVLAASKDATSNLNSGAKPPSPLPVNAVTVPGAEDGVIGWDLKKRELGEHLKSLTSSAGDWWDLKKREFEEHVNNLTSSPITGAGDRWDLRKRELEEHRES
ncbi:hypothetical protein Clacol_003203 [Clathrus columnatus]|uniref:Uncharacterized protein n=1 Tax=Clathrus columnatus TaxID=1419009 RepID=A0AAV5A661_9AGAM|nr:hypothetical protein Clacol_003203 [Clathrus columnatus]